MPHRVTYSELCMALPSVLFINTRDISSLETLWIFKRKRLKWRYYGLLRNKYCAKCHNCDVTIIRVIRFCGINQIYVTEPVDCPQQEGYFLRAWTCYQSHSLFFKYFSGGVVLNVDVHTYTFKMTCCNGYQLQSPNLHQTCIIKCPRLVLKMGVIDLEFEGHLAILTQMSGKWHSMSHLYTERGWPMSVTRPNVLLLPFVAKHSRQTHYNNPPPPPPHTHTHTHKSRWEVAKTHWMHFVTRGDKVINGSEN